MSYPPEAPFNPPLTKVPILGPSSGNPRSFQDPKSVASIGQTIQAMADQATADRLYDAVPPIKEKFSDYIPWIVQSQSCRVEGYANYNGIGITALVFTGALLIVLSLMDKSRNGSRRIR